MSARDWITLFFSGVLAVCACLTLILIFAQVIIYGCQLWQMKKSTDAATKAAKAAENSVTLAMKNAHLDQRAWVAVTQIATTQPKAGEAYKPLIILKNSGKTFAKKVRIAASWEFITKRSYPDFSLEDQKSREIANRDGFIIAPDAEHHLTDTTTNTPLTESEVRDYESGDLQMFIHGKITYVDIFKCEHWTTFVLYSNPEQLDIPL
jgi:hypothetical protein